jgi:hypothetical protein
MVTLLNISDDTQWMECAGNIHAMEDSEGELSDVDSSTLSEMTITPELYMLSLPSSLATGEIHHKSLDSIVIIEVELQCMQINNSLHGLQLALGEKAMLFRANVCNVNS